MPDVRSGITRGPDRLGVTAEVARERAKIVRQTEASHGVPGDHVFASADEIRRELFTPGPTDIRSGLSYGDPVEAHERTQALIRDVGGKIALVETYEAMRDELAELKRAPVREEHVENLVNAMAENDVEAVAASWLSLTPRERTEMVEEGWVDEAEISELDALANRAHTTLSEHAHAEAELRRSVQAQMDRALTYEAMLAERGLSGPSADHWWATTAGRAAAEGVNLEVLSGEQFRAQLSAAEIAGAEDRRAQAVATMKVNVLNAQTGNVRDGLEVLGPNGYQPVVPGGPIEVKPDYAAAADRVLGRFDESAEAIRASVAYDEPKTAEYRSVQAQGRKLFAADAEQNPRR